MIRNAAWGQAFIVETPSNHARWLTLVDSPAIRKRWAVRYHLCMHLVCIVIWRHLSPRPWYLLLHVYSVLGVWPNRPHLHAFWDWFLKRQEPTGTHAKLLTPRHVTSGHSTKINGILTTFSLRYEYECVGIISWSTVSACRSYVMLGMVRNDVSARESILIQYVELEMITSDRVRRMRIKFFHHRMRTLTADPECLIQVDMLWAAVLFIRQVWRYWSWIYIILSMQLL